MYVSFNHQEGKKRKSTEYLYMDYLIIITIYTCLIIVIASSEMRDGGLSSHKTVPRLCETLERQNNLSSPRSITSIQALRWSRENQGKACKAGMRADLGNWGHLPSGGNLSPDLRLDIVQWKQDRPGQQYR